MSTDPSSAELINYFPAYALVDLDAIVQNVRAVQAHVGPAVQVMAVVKANGYGHGIVRAAQAALEGGASRLAVGRTGEGVQLRRAGIDVPILNLGYTMPAEAEMIVAQGLAATVITIEGAEALSGRAAALGRPVPVHIKVDTGMGRFGLLPAEVVPFLEQISRLPHLELEGIFTHFATADEGDKQHAYRQLAVFRDVLQAAQMAGYSFRLRHAANSGAILDLPEAHLDAVRPGIMTYGLYPSAEVSKPVPLIPALSVRAHVARLRTLPAGSCVSYGCTYVTTRPTPVALIPFGYADGYPRQLSNRGVALIRGQRVPVIGRVCMDQLMVDVSGVDGVRQDEEVVLIGRQGQDAITAEEVGDLAGTVNYEIVTRLAQRVPRLYVRDGRVVEVLHLNGRDAPDGPQANPHLP